MRAIIPIKAALAALMMTLATGAWACSAVGANTHVGELLGVDAAAKSFTVLDAQTIRAITFLADQSILSRLVGVEGQVLVEFEAEGTDLRATNVQF